MNFDELLKMRDFPTQGKKIVLVRHTLNEVLPSEAEYVRHSPERLATWQRIQRKDNKPGDNKNQGRRFWGCDVVVSFCAPTFYGDKADNTATFFGVFHNESGDAPEEFGNAREVPPELAKVIQPYKDEQKLFYFFNLRKDARFEDLEGRVVIKWDWGAQNWVQVYNPENPKGEVLQILPKGKTARR